MGAARSVKEVVEEGCPAHTSPEGSVAPQGQAEPQPAAKAPIGWLAALPHAVTAALANFCFGYHIGIFNGPLEAVAAELGFAGDALMQGFVVSIFLVGAFLGSIGGGTLADLVGRRRSFQLDAIPLVLGSVLSANAQTVEQMALGRFLVGIGVGAAAGFVALYISEVAPTKYRGGLGCVCQVGTCLGIIAALLVGIPSETDPHWWEEAQSTVAKLWGESEVEVAMQELRAVEEAEKDMVEATWAELASPKYIKVAGIGGMLFVLQQFAGINGVLYFSSATFKDAGIENGMLASAAVGVFNLVGALAALPLMDSQGRRNLLMISYGGMAVSMGSLVAALVLPLSPDVSHTISVVGTLAYVFTFALGAGPVCNFAIGLLFLELVQRFGVPAIYTSFGVVSLLSVVFANAFIVETKGKSLEEIEKLMGAADA
eukprot:jgi/Mesen1/5759/ME000292S04851